MANEGSVAPQERVNITYKSSTGGAQSEVELPLKMLFLGDYTGRTDGRPLEERKPINVDKDNFQQVLAEQNLSVTMGVHDKLSQDASGSLNVTLKLSGYQGEPQRANNSHPSKPLPVSVNASWACSTCFQVVP